MEFDVKETVEKIVEKVKNDPAMLEQFKEDPVKALEALTGIDLPDDQVKPVIAAVKAKLTADNVAGALGGLGKLFDK